MVIIATAYLEYQFCLVVLLFDSKTKQQQQQKHFLKMRPIKPSIFISIFQDNPSFV